MKYHTWVCLVIALAVFTILLAIALRVIKHKNLFKAVFNYPDPSEYPAASESLDSTKAEAALDLYKYYYDMAFKLLAAYYAATGAYLALYYENERTTWLGVFSMLFPILLAIFLGEPFDHCDLRARELQHRLSKTGIMSFTKFLPDTGKEKKGYKASIWLFLLPASIIFVLMIHQACTLLLCGQGSPQGATPPTTAAVSSHANAPSCEEAPRKP